MVIMRKLGKADIAFLSGNARTIVISLAPNKTDPAPDELAPSSGRKAVWQMPCEPGPGTRLTFSEPDLAQAAMDPTLASNATHSGCEVVPNPDGDPTRRADTAPQGEGLALCPRTT